MKIYTEQEKQLILNDCKIIGVMNTLRKYSISKTTLRNWRFPEKIINYRKIYYNNNKEKLKQKANIFYYENKEKILEKMKKFNNTEYGKQLHRKWHLKNKDYRKIRKSKDPQYVQDRKDYEREHSKKYIKNNPKAKISLYLRNRINKALKEYSLEKSNHLAEYLGCSIKELMIYLQERFQEGMNWENHGKWHIDHIKPCSSFDLTKEEEQRKCFHYTNLQPLWAKDNLSKGCRY